MECRLPVAVNQFSPGTSTIAFRKGAIQACKYRNSHRPHRLKHGCADRLDFRWPHIHRAAGAAVFRLGLALPVFDAAVDVLD